MRSLLLIGLVMGFNFASANDGGISAIEVSDIRMREYDNRGKELRRITDPNFKITFKGIEAEKLQKILPASVSVVTTMNPAIADEYAKTFKALGIYNQKTSVTSKAIVIGCSDGELVTDASDKVTIKKTGETVCEITINGTADPLDYFGDKQDYHPSCTP